MEINGLKVLECTMPDMNLENIVKPEFLELLRNEMDNVKIIHIALASGTDEDQRLSSLAHISAEDVKNNVLSIKVKKEKEMDQIIDAIKTFNKGE